MVDVGWLGVFLAVLVGLLPVGLVVQIHRLQI
jgi:hypothetical protein